MSKMLKVTALHQSLMMCSFVLAVCLPLVCANFMHRQGTPKINDIWFLSNLGSVDLDQVRALVSVITEITVSTGA